MTLINRHRILSPLVTVLGSAIFSLKINSLPVKSTSHWRKSPHNHCKNIKGVLCRLSVTCSTKCSETSQMSCCLSKQLVQQTGLKLREMVGLQNVDCLNCTKTVLFPLKNKKRMPVNARSLPEFNVNPSDVTFSYKKKQPVINITFTKNNLISNTGELGTLHLLALYAYNTAKLSLIYISVYVYIYI